VIQALNLQEGSVMVDFLSGVGDFTLKLCSVVGKKGGVVAENIRRQSLAFLRITALLQGRHNLEIVRGETDDPRPPSVFADAGWTTPTLGSILTPK
jgi:hypothetical protein